MAPHLITARKSLTISNGKKHALNLEENLEEIVSNVKKKRHRAKLVIRVEIQKGNGKTRPLGIPACQIR